MMPLLLAEQREKRAAWSNYLNSSCRWRRVLVWTGGNMSARVLSLPSWVNLIVNPALAVVGPTKRTDSFSICLSIFNLPQRTQGGDGKRRRRRCWWWGASLLSYIHFEVSTLGSFETMPLQYALLPRRMKQNVFAILLSHPAALNRFFFPILPHQKRVLLFWSADGVQHTSESNQSAVSDSARSCLRRSAKLW